MSPTAAQPLTCGENGSPECRWTLAIEEPGARSEQMFTTYVPCVAFGKAAETIAKQLDAGTVVCIRDGRLRFRSTLVNGGKVSTLEVSCWQVSVLAPAIGEASAS